MIEARLGEKGLATDLLEQTLSEGFEQSSLFFTEPAFDSLRDFAPFQQLLRLRG